MAACVVVAFKEVAEMHSEWIMVLVVIPLDGSVFDCAVYPLGLSVRLWMAWFDYAMFDPSCDADHMKRHSRE